MQTLTQTPAAGDAQDNRQACAARPTITGFSPAQSMRIRRGSADKPTPVAFRKASFAVHNRKKR
jgi:hypothetical protein